jgi:hypothetical protein
LACGRPFAIHGVPVTRVAPTDACQRGRHRRAIVSASAQDRRQMLAGLFERRVASRDVV